MNKERRARNLATKLQTITDQKIVIRNSMAAIIEFEAARRMCIEQRLAEAIRAFGLDSLTGAVNLNIDLDVTLSILAAALCAALRKRLPGNATATPDTLQRRFIETSGTIINSGDHITVQLDRRTYSPVLRQSDIPATTTVPWWGNRQLHFEYT